MSPDTATDTAVVALPKTLLQRNRRAVWTSPDRGVA